jgi:sec-independent protein translocase protein TatB
MFGLSWAQIGIILLVGVFVLGPERIPTAVTWVMTSLRKLRTMAAGAQAELRKEIGPELDELRRQVADLQSLKEIQELRELRDLHPKRLIGKGILGDEFSGGISGFLGMTDNGSAPAGTPPIGQNGPAVPANMSGQSAQQSGATPAAFPTPIPTAIPTANPAAAPTSVPVAGHAPSHRPIRALDAGERPPFDPDGT